MKTINWKIEYESGNKGNNELFCKEFIKSYPDFCLVENDENCWVCNHNIASELATLDVILRLKQFMTEHPQFKNNMLSIKIRSFMTIVEDTDCTKLFADE